MENHDMTTFNVKLGAAVPRGIAIDSTAMVAEGDREAYSRLWNANPALQYIVEYGWKQSLNDKLAGAVKKFPEYTQDMFLALVEKRRDAILAGTIAVRPGGSRITDPVLREARRLAILAWNGDYTDAARKTALVAIMRRDNVDDKTAKATIITALAATEAMVTQARANLAAAPKVDLGALFASTEVVDDEESDEGDDETDESDDEGDDDE
jgi:hypothetical protein